MADAIATDTGHEASSIEGVTPMTFPNPHTIRLYQNLYDCLSDPGELDLFDALRAADIHLGCSERCHPRRRAQQSIDAVRTGEGDAECPLEERQ
ncbi:hypothetical protein [Nocardia sp. NPDC048505]|uniref:hypothetical protein n=1 Tax=unclassified Nocardia TaxID=2637762 RepID=UPI0033FCBC2C